MLGSRAAVHCTRGGESLLVGESVVLVLVAGAGVGGRRAGPGGRAVREREAGGAAAARPGGRAGVGGVRQSLQSRLLGVLGTSAGLARPLLHRGLLVPLLVQIPATETRLDPKSTSPSVIGRSDQSQVRTRHTGSV